MRLVIAGSGSQGDTRPYLALAEGLRARGHESVVCLDRTGRDTADTLGLEFHELAGDFRRHLDGGQGQRALEKADGGLTGLALFRDVARAHSRQWIDTITEAVRSHDADVVLGSGLATYAALTAAELTGRRPALAAAFPLTPTSAFPSAVTPVPLPRRLNRASHHVATQAVWSVFRGPTNRVRREAGLGRLVPSWYRIPVLYGFSPGLVPRPPDWPANARITGAWHLAEPGWTPPADLADFLDRGDPPVYIGFGSMAASGTADLTRSLLEALDGDRALIAPGWSGIERELGPLPDSVHVVGPTPHTWLLPRCVAAVHHCGSGTTHAVARAGIPSIPVPFAADQPFWARRLREAGIGTRPMDRRAPEPGAIAEALCEARSARMRTRAARVAVRMAHEDSIGSVIDHLTHWHTST